ncbi:MAG: ParA family protein, partial [Nitrospira sp.]|nr:ParA family protein [Nitrospira sp.]
FDLVIFDCPPRLTTSTVNALTTSDYVLIPTKLDERSFEAIPRTLSFLDNLRPIAQPKILGVVANEVRYWRRPILLKVHQSGMARLRELVTGRYRDTYIFQSMVELSTNVAFHREKNVVPAVDDKIRQDVFREVAEELRERIGR